MKGIWLEDGVASVNRISFWSQTSDMKIGEKSPLWVKSGRWAHIERVDVNNSGKAPTTVKEAVESYVESIEGKNRSWKQTERILDAHLKSEWGKQPLEDLRRLDLIGRPPHTAFGYIKDVRDECERITGYGFFVCPFLKTGKYPSNSSSCAFDGTDCGFSRGPHPTTAARSKISISFLLRFDLAPQNHCDFPTHSWPF